MNKIEHYTAALIATTAWFGLGLQFYLIMFEPVVGDVPAGQRFINFFSYFTVLSNLIVAICLTAGLASPSSTVGRFFLRNSTRTAVAVYITVVGLVYTLALRSIWNPSGLVLIADRTLHDVVPLLYLLAFSCRQKRAELEQACLVADISRRIYYVQHHAGGNNGLVSLSFRRCLAARLSHGSG